MSRRFSQASFAPRWVINVLSMLIVVAPDVQATTTAWVGGYWYDGKGFDRKTMYSVDGVLTEIAPRVLDATVKLNGGYVVPAFGDAHHHGIDSERGLERKIDSFLDAGIMYVMNPNVIPTYLTPELRSKINNPASIDVSFSLGGLTGTAGHPEPLHQSLAERNIFPGLTASDMESLAYHTVDTTADLERKWARILASDPDFIKVFLNGAESHRATGEAADTRLGVPQDVLVRLVELAATSGRRVVAHIDTAEDFQRAVLAGVDVIGHMPLFDPLEVPDGALEDYLLTNEQAAEASRHNVVVVLTASVLPRFRAGRWTDAMKQKVLEVQRRNILTLQQAGVRLAMGSDGISGESPMTTARDEVAYLHANALLENEALVRALAQTTPQTIFPDRKLGWLGEGYEANFLVLSGNPLDDVENLFRITIRVKAGVPMSSVGGRGR